MPPEDTAEGGRSGRSGVSYSGPSSHWRGHRPHVLMASQGPRLLTAASRAWDSGHAFWGARALSLEQGTEAVGRRGRKEATRCGHAGGGSGGEGSGDGAVGGDSAGSGVPCGMLTSTVTSVGSFPPPPAARRSGRPGGVLGAGWRRPRGSRPRRRETKNQGDTVCVRHEILESVFYVRITFPSLHPRA